MAIRTGLMLAATNTYVSTIKDFAKKLELEFSSYQQECVVNAVRSINPLLEKNGYTWQTFTVDNIITVLQQAAFLELNTSATPNECYYIIRKGSYDKKTKSYGDPVIEFGIEGAGNDRILRKFGQDVADLKSYIVYEGDEFTEGYMDGWDMTLPKYKRTFKTNKPLKVVYLIKKTNGEIDVQYADTQDVKKSLLASVKQNGADDKLLRDLAKLDLYDILEDEKWLDYKIQKAGYNNSTYETPLLNPSYTSPISMYNMIERKLRNHATRKYPKNFNANEISTLYEDTFDEKYNEKGIVVSAEEQVQIATTEIEEKRASVPLQKVEEDDRPSLAVEVEEPTQKEEPVVKEEVIVEELSQKEETVVEEAKEPETQEEEPVVENDDIPDWMK